MNAWATTIFNKNYICCKPYAFSNPGKQDLDSHYQAKEEGVFLQSKVLVWASCDGETLEKVSLSYTKQQIVSWQHLSIKHSGRAYEEKQQAGRQLAKNASDSADKSMVAERPEAKDDGGNVKLGFEIALITIQRLATVLPRSHANCLHAVGDF